MYIEHIASFTDYLANARRSLDEICKYLVLHTFKNLQPSAIYLGEVVSDGHLELRSSFGFETKYISQWTKIPLTLNIPLTYALRNEECIIHTRDEFFGDYPQLDELGTIDSKWEHCIASPIQSRGAYFLVLNGTPQRDEEFDFFLKSVGHLLALQLQKGSHEAHLVERVEAVPTRLTARQELIRDLLVKGFTNYHIAQEIGYSESLVRQETIAIYSVMHVSGRKELMKAMESEVARQR